MTNQFISGHVGKPIFINHINKTINFISQYNNSLQLICTKKIINISIKNKKIMTFIIKNKYLFNKMIVFLIKNHNIFRIILSVINEEPELFEYYVYEVKKTLNI